MWQWLKDHFDAVVFATLVGPILAVQAQKWIERWQEEKREKIAVFTALMTTRAVQLSAEHVHALNRVGLAFFKVPAVMTAWKAYLANLDERPAKENEQKHWDRRADLFRTMLFVMSQHLGYKFTETDIKNTAYRPELHGAMENTHLRLLGFAEDVIAGRKELPITVKVAPDMLEAQQQQAGFWKEVVEGKAAVPVKTEGKQGDLHRLQVECLVRLYGARWVLAVPSSEAERSRFNDYLNQIGVLYASHPSVLLAFKDYRTGGGVPSQFTKLVRTLCDACGLKVDNLTDADLQGVATANSVTKPTGAAT